jgi:signal transduction histidine kinase
LRIFSRTDNAEKVPFNIQEGIDSTLLILKHRLKATDQHPAIEIIQEQDSSLPEVACYPGQLSQVLMNIIANAVDAIEEGNQGRSFREIESNPGMIKISTSLLEDKSAVAIWIRDNGPGMSEEVKQRIFDYSFTTKAVGKGTGLGLSISRQIIEEKHGGKLTCNSVPGEGTEFAIELPIEF